MTCQDVIFYYRQDDKTKKYHKDRFSTFGGKLVNSIEKAIILGFFKKNMENEKVLDMGTGTGRVAMWLQGEKVGVDSSISMLKKAKKAGLDVVCSDIRFLPFKTATFSTVIAVRVFIRVKSPLPVFKEVARVLGKGGHFIFDTSNKYSIGYFINRFSREPPHSLFSRNDIQKYLRLATFKIFKIKPFFLVPRGVYQKIKWRFIIRLWYIERLLLKTKISQIACTLFWHTNIAKYSLKVEDI